MTIKRYSGISSIARYPIKAYELPTKEWDESLTDMSTFVPVSELTKRVGTLPPLARDVLNSVYDFPDGVDNGAAIPLSRSKGADLAEVAGEVASGKAKLAKAVKEAKEDQELIDRVNNGLGIKTTSQTSSDGSSGSSD